MPFTNTTHTSTQQADSYPAGSFGSSPSNSHAGSSPIASQTYAGELYYGIGRFLRNQWDYLYQTFWKDSGASPEAIAQKQRDIYVSGLKECIEHLKPAIENVRKNPNDKASLGKVDDLAQHYATYVNVHPTLEFHLVQQELFQPIREQVQRLTDSSLKRKLKMLLPVLATAFSEPKNKESNSFAQEDEYSVTLSQSYYAEEKTVEKSSAEKRHVEQASSPPLAVVNLPLDNQVKDMVIQNGYAYTVNGQAGLKILDVGNPNNITIVSQYDTPGDAQRIVLDNGYAYIADGTSGLQIINVKNVTNPIFAGIWMTGNPVIDLAVINEKAYIADGTNTLTEIDVSVPESVYYGIVFIPDKNGAYSVAISANFAYVTDGGAGLQIIDMSNLGNPKLVGNLRTTNAYGIAISGNFSYVADTSGFRIIDLSNPTNPRLVANFSTLNAVDVAVSGNFSYVTDITSLRVIDVSNATNPRQVGNVSTVNAIGVALFGNFAYVADDTFLRIIDVSNVTNPKILGNIGTTYARDVAISGNFAYVADGISGLVIIDVSNATNPRFVGSIKTMDATRVAVSKNFAYIADGVSGLRVIDVSNATNPRIVKNVGTSGLALGVTVSGDLVYVTDNISGLRIIRVNPLISVNTYTFQNSILQLSRVNNHLWVRQSNGFQAFDSATPMVSTHFWLTNSSYAVDVSGNLAYVAGGGSGLCVVDVSNLTNPTLLSTLPPTTATLGVAASGNRVYVADNGAGLGVVDVSNVTNPKYLSTLLTVLAQDVVVQGNTTYVADYSSLRAIDVSNATNPRLLSLLPTTAALSVAISGNMAYVADTISGLRIIDVSNTTNLTLLGTFPTTYARGVAVSGNMVYVADDTSGLRVIDVSNAANPTLLSSFPMASAYGVAVSGNILYVADYNFGLRVVDVSNATNPTLVYQFQIPGAANSAVSGNIMYVAGSTGLTIFNMTSLPWLPFYKLSPSPKAMRIVEPYSFIATSNALGIWNISDPTQSQYIGGWNTPFVTNSVDLIGNQVLLGHAGGITVLDISNPAFPKPISNYTCGQPVQSFVVNNGTLYLSATYQCEGLLVLNHLKICSRAQPLTIRNRDIQINKGQNLRLTPNDLSASCGNTTTPNLGTLFNITGISHAQFQTRNISGIWNNASYFWGKDITQGNVAFIHDSSPFAPELNISVTDGQTTLTSPVTVYFNISQSTPQIENIGFAINANGTTALTVDQFQITDTDTKLANVVISVTSSQEGYFTTMSDPTQPISDFTYYQLQNGQIQFVHNGTLLPQVTLSVGDGSGQPVQFRPLISFFDTNNPATPSVPIAAVVGSTVGALAVIGLGVFGIFKYRQHQDQEENTVQSVAGQRLR